MPNVKGVLITDEDISSANQKLTSRYDNAKGVMGCRQLHCFEAIPGRVGHEWMDTNIKTIFNEDRTRHKTILL